MALVEGDGRDRRRRIVADAGKRTERGRVVGEAAAELVGDDLGTGLQVARAGVVAEAGPGLHHVFARRGSERFHIRPARDEVLEIGFDRRDAGLLQHDLREPDAVRIRLHAARAVLRPDAPGELAGMAVVPGEQRGGIGHGEHHRP